MAKAFLHGLVLCSGRVGRQRLSLRGSLTILTYHSFSKYWPPGTFSSLPISRFERQIRYLKKHYHLVSLKQGYEYLRNKEKGEKPWLAITIDDGFGDNHKYAWPVLSRYQVPATIFLATDFIDSGRPPWPTQLAEIFDNAGSGIAEGCTFLKNSDVIDRVAGRRTLKSSWRSLAPEDRFKRLAELRQQLGVDTVTSHPPLTWDQIREMSSAGIDFGSHTAFHSILSEVGEICVKREVEEAKKRIEDELQISCHLFAYPDGKYNENVMEIVQSSGHHLAVTQDFGCNTDAKQPFALKRIEMPFNDPLTSFRCRTALCLFPQDTGNSSAAKERH